VKYFICALDKVNLGIPSEQTERIIPCSREQTSVYAAENQPSGTEEAFISLPALLGDTTAVRNGLVLKSGGEASQATIKTILLTPKIDIDLEIPDESIYRLPDAFVGRFSFFTGASFAAGSTADSGQNLILILNPQKLKEVYNG
jgi:hypothetical protein